MPAIKRQAEDGDADRCQAGGGDPRTLKWSLTLAIAVVTLITYAPSLRNGFVNWDDDVNIVENAAFRGLDADHLAWMFTSHFGGHYQPLSWLSLAVDHAVWGLRPFGYHLSNIVLHAVAAVLFFSVAVHVFGWVRRRSFAEGMLPGASDANSGGQSDVTVGVLWCAALAAGLFAWHPLRVESVAWVTERRDVLSGVFAMACVWAYCRGIDRPRRAYGWLVAAWICLALSLLSKAAAMTLPVVLLVIDVYPAGRLRRAGVNWAGLLVEKVPFFALSAVAAVQAMWAQQSAGAWRSLSAFDGMSRLAAAVYGYCFYLWKWIAPHNLTPLYPLPASGQLGGVRLLVLGGGLLAILVIAWLLRRRYPAILAAGICYAALLAPVSGIAQSGKQLVADRYSYLSLLPVVLLAAGAFGLLVRRVAAHDERRGQYRLLIGLGGAYLVGLCLLAAQQTAVWKSSERLWRHALAVDSANSVAHVNLAETLRDQGRNDEALQEYAQAVELAPNDAKAHNGAGLALLAMGRPADALAALQNAVSLAPENYGYLCNVGYVLAGFGRLEEAGRFYQKAWRIAPERALAPRMLGAVLQDAGQCVSARAVYEEALELRPGDRELRGGLAWVLATCPEDAARDGVRALDLARPLAEATDYRDPWVLQTMSAACAEAGDFTEAERFARMGQALAAERGAQNLATDLAAMAGQFAIGQPYRDAGAKAAATTNGLELP